jgi:quinol monooxygenase YgiN
MIVVTGQVRIHPDKRPQAIELAVWMQRHTRAEPGCLEYTFSGDLEDPSLIHVTERWQDAVALEQHFKTAHMAQFNAQLPQLIKGRPVVQAHTVTDTRPL